MPLDTGAVTHSLLISPRMDVSEPIEDRSAVMEDALTIGAAFRATRKRMGRSLQDIADATRIKRSYLEAIEEMRLEELPSRPFTIGYVRAYARALGMDGEAAVQRFRQDAPADVEPLRPPVGVGKHADARIGLLLGGGAVVITAVLLWNLAQHAVTDNSPPPPAVAEVAAPPATAPAAAAPATLTLSAAQPAPQESTIPDAYQTPGLGGVVSGDPTKKAAEAKPGDPVATSSGPPAAPTFTPHGAVYGASAPASAVTLQARKSVSLVIRNADGSVQFAQQLKPGEAYRAPMTAGLSVDVSDASAINVYLNGQLHPGLSQTVTPLSRLTPAATAG